MGGRGGVSPTLASPAGQPVALSAAHACCAVPLWTCTQPDLCNLPEGMPIGYSPSGCIVRGISQSYETWSMWMKRTPPYCWTSQGSMRPCYHPPLWVTSQARRAVARHSSRMSTAVVGSRSCTWRHAPPDPCILPEGMLYVIPRPGMLCGIPTGCHGPRIPHGHVQTRLHSCTHAQSLRASVRVHTASVLPLMAPMVRARAASRARARLPHAVVRGGWWARERTCRARSPVSSTRCARGPVYIQLGWHAAQM